MFKFQNPFDLKKLFKKSCKNLAQNEKGLTLIEILIALTIIGIAGTFITGKLMESKLEGERKSAKIQLQNVKARLMEYRRHCNFYPTSDQGLEALVEKPSQGRECKNYQPGGYIEGGKVPNDPWGNPFIYESDGQKINALKSLGPTGEAGGEGNNKEINYDDEN
jgi:general secretion pathway protein G